MFSSAKSEVNQVILPLRWRNECEGESITSCDFLLLFFSQILPAVRDKEKLAASLLNIVKCRFKLFLEHSPHLSDNISSMETTFGYDSWMVGMVSLEQYRRFTLIIALTFFSLFYGVGGGNLVEHF